MHPFLVQNLAMPLLYRRTWPRVRRDLARLRDTEGCTPHATMELWERRALDAARAAGVHAPFFRRLYRGHGAIGTMDEFRRLPVVTKEMLREHLDDMLRDGAVRGVLQRGTTGGSTGVPTPYYHDEAWWCRASAVALRGDAWAGWRLGEPHATLWGTPISESLRAKWTRIVGERARGQILLPGIDLSDAGVDRNVDRLVRAKPRLITGDASVLAAHARRIAERGVEFPAPRSVVSSAEALDPAMRTLVEDAFRAPVYDRYGSREVGMVAQECSVHQGLHVATEHVFVEVDVDGRPARPGETGRILITLLGEPALPIVRYEVGDAAVAGDAEPCLCGLPYPRIARIEGRLLEMLRRADGGSVAGTFFPHLMRSFAFVREFQVVQDERGAVEIRVVPEGPRPAESAVEPVVRATREVLGDLPVRVVFVTALERTPTGRVRLTHSRWRVPDPVAAAARR